MKLKQHIIQRSFNDKVESVRHLDRVNYELLTSQLSYPVVWSYDDYLDAWLPAESTPNTNHFLRTSKDLSVRVKQLHRLGLVENDRISTEILKLRFNRDGYVIIKQLFDPLYCRALIAKKFYQADHLQERHPDMEGISRLSINDLPIIRLLHQATQNLVNKIVDVPVKTSYSFTALYDNGSTLPRHTDRPQCVFNISLMLDSSPTGADLTAWPLFIETRGLVNEIKLEVGDAVLYSGTQDPHWRGKMPSEVETVLGTFFHYVPLGFKGKLS